MQPAATIVSPPTAFPEPLATVSAASPQHGPGSSVVFPLLHDPARGGSSSEYSGNSRGPGSACGSARSEDGWPEQPAYLNGRSGSSSPRNAIARYEALSTSPNYGGSGFVVTRTDWTGKDPAESPMLRFPNEILIHALSFLDPTSLTNVALVSRRFRDLVQDPHSWRAAFSRYFPSPFHLLGDHEVASDRRYFTPLSVASTNADAWRNEYTQRTQLLRSLNKGKVHVPDGAPNSAAGPTTGGLMVTYPSVTGQTSVSHMVANFASGGVRCVHASLESQYVSASDGITGKTEKRPRAALDGFGGLNMRADAPELRSIRNDHSDFAVGAEMNVNRVMDISEELGWIMGENAPSGVCYVHPYYSPYPSDLSSGIILDCGEPQVTGAHPSITAVWIAKKRIGGVMESTAGKAGIVVGNSRGVVRMFSIHPGRQRTEVREWATFALCPGIPIVEVKVDEDYLPRRQRLQHPWIVVANALGEVYYLRRSPPDHDITLADWKMVPQTERIQTSAYSTVFPEPYDNITDDVRARRKREQTEELMKMSWYGIKDLWEGCRMDWFVEVDWAGLNVVVGRKGAASYWYGTELERADGLFMRYHLTIEKQAPHHHSHATEKRPSIFGGPSAESRSDSPADFDPNAESVPEPEDESDAWHPMQLDFGTASFSRITAIALNDSTLARIPASGSDSPTPPPPGGNARFLSFGTNTGSIWVFNIRGSGSSDSPAVLQPIRVVHTESPAITTLAMSSLILVHGGSDGLVQAWDPLASTEAPVRTLHSRFSAKARRRMDQSTGLGAGLDDNQFAARCLVLDSDATRLRGVVALGTFIRSWSFAPNLGEGKKSRKKFSGARRGAGTPHRGKGEILEGIEVEAEMMRRQRKQEEKERIAMEKRYGVGRGHAALSEEEMLQYAMMVSQESFEQESGAASAVGSVEGSVDGSAKAHASASAPPRGTAANGVDDEEAALAEALRLSVLEAEAQKPAEEDDWEDARALLVSGPGSSHASSTFNSTPSPSSSSAVPVSTKQRKPSSSGKSPKKKGWQKVSLDPDAEWPSVGRDADKGKGRALAAPPGDYVDDDMELAIRLSLMEEEKRTGQGASWE